VPAGVVEEAAKTHEATIDPRHIERIVEALNELLADRNVGARFVVRRDLDELQVVLENRTTGEVVRKIPPDDVIRRREELSRLEGIGLDAIV
jgi:flagellar protein FlaG